MKEVCGTRFRRKEGKKKANQLKKGSSKKERTRESSKEWMKEEDGTKLKEEGRRIKKQRNDTWNEGMI